MYVVVLVMLQYAGTYETKNSSTAHALMNSCLEKFSLVFQACHQIDFYKNILFMSDP